MTIQSMKIAGMALNVGLCNNIGKCEVKKSQLRGLGLWRRPALKSQKYGKPNLIRNGPNVIQLPKLENGTTHI